MHMPQAYNITLANSYRRDQRLDYRVDSAFTMCYPQQNQYNDD